MPERERVASGRKFPYRRVRTELLLLPLTRTCPAYTSLPPCSSVLGSIFIYIFTFNRPLTDSPSLLDDMQLTQSSPNEVKAVYRPVEFMERYDHDPFVKEEARRLWPTVNPWETSPLENASKEGDTSTQSVTWQGYAESLKQTCKALWGTQATSTAALSSNAPSQSQQEPGNTLFSTSTSPADPAPFAVAGSLTDGSPTDVSPTDRNTTVTCPPSVTDTRPPIEIEPAPPVTRPARRQSPSHSPLSSLSSLLRTANMF